MSLIEREIQISWVIHAMKEIIGLENLRKYIIEKYYPDIKNKTFIKTFDSFQQYEIKPFNNKEKEIIEYCEKIIHLKNRVVFTATNIQENADDNETHYQCFILDNENKTLRVINPSQDKTSDDGYGIYKPEVAYKTINPFFKKRGYSVEFVELSNAAQMNENDVYCQTWSLYMLLVVLINNNKKIKISKYEKKRYNLILTFFKELLQDEYISSLLNETYYQIIDEERKCIKDSGVNFNNIKNINPTKILLSMSTKELMEI